MARSRKDTALMHKIAATVLGLTAPLVLTAWCSPSALAGISSPSHSTTATVYRWGVPGSQGAVKQLERTTPTAVAGIKGRVVQIATSNSDGYALTSNGSVWAWGVDNYGEFGNGTIKPYGVRAVQVRFPKGVKIAALPNPMPFDGALAIDSRGHAWGWGLDADGDLCLPTVPALNASVELRPKQLPLTDVSLATGARTHSLFYSKGTVYACGSGEDGVLGTGSTASTSTPVPVDGFPAATRVTALTSSWEGSGALLANGAYYDWGYNADGQLGNGSTGTGTNSDVPVKVKLPSAVRQVFQGGSGPTNGQTIAILANGSVWTWGANKSGQLGNGSTASSDVPVSVHMPKGVTFVKVNSGGDTCFGIDRQGRLWAWGDNRQGQLGTGSSAHQETTPVSVGSIRFAEVSSTARNVAGL
jgi:alpha-tubulin suppressor-like RCC1 family protein